MILRLFDDLAKLSSTYLHSAFILSILLDHHLLLVDVTMSNTGKDTFHIAFVGNNK